MSVEIKDRPLSLLTLSGLQAFTFPDTLEHGISATCHMSLMGYDGSENGPGANVFVGVAVSPNATIHDAERAALARTHEVLVRLASFSVEELEAAFMNKRRKDADAGPPFEANQG